MPRTMGRDELAVRAMALARGSSALPSAVDIIACLVLFRGVRWIAGGGRFGNFALDLEELGYQPIMLGGGSVRDDERPLEDRLLELLSVGPQSVKELADVLETTTATVRVRLHKMPGVEPTWEKRDGAQVWRIAPSS